MRSRLRLRFLVCLIALFLIAPVFAVAAGEDRSAKNQVTDPGGKPVPGALVSLEEGAGQGLLTVPAAAPGKARLSVPAGRYRLKVEAEGRCPARESKLELSAGEARKIVLVLDACPTVTGVVVDSQGKPVAGARLQIDF